MDPWESFSQSLFDESSSSDDVDYETHDFCQDYETFDAWMYRQHEESVERRQELDKLNRPLKSIFKKIGPMKHVFITADYGSTKRMFMGEKFQRFMHILPLEQVEFFKTNLRVTEFIYWIQPGQFKNLKPICIEELIHTQTHTLHQLLEACPVLEEWISPVPATMLHAFGAKKRLIKILLLTKFLGSNSFKEILKLEELVASSSKCPIGKSSYPDIVRLIQHTGNTLKVIRMSNALLKYVIDSDMPPMVNVRKVNVPKSTSKANKVKALTKFLNAIIEGKNS